ncbi:glycosyltransferase [Flavobacterium sp.]|uniref:glycosyltransferase n=1 Tax=Flavobacterium sp. TaxID=239 RepID=UPI0028BD8680|nr:glycosyltransferase [Flavobacterium sp.]
MKKIKVLHCLETLGAGGVERRRLSIVKLLPKDRFEVKIVCTQLQSILHEEFEKLGIEIIVVGKLKHPFDFTIHQKVQKVIADFRPDIIHGAVFEGVSMAAVNGFLKKVPHIVIEETSDPIHRNWKANFLLRIFSFVSDKVVGVSQATCDYLTYKAKINPKKIKLINNGVKEPRAVLETEKIALKKELHIAENDFVIGSVGRMIDDNNKRFSDLIKAVSLLFEKGLPVKLLLVGEGKERPKYEKLAEDLGISSQVIFAKYQNDVAKYYSIMDVFSLVSANESFGLVLAEAMYCRLPIVATRVGGMQYIVDENITGFLVEKFNVMAIADALETIYKNQELRTAFGENGYSRVVKEFSETVYVNKIEQLYLELMTKK